MIVRDFGALLSGSRQGAGEPDGTAVVISYSFARGAALPDVDSLEYHANRVNAMSEATQKSVRAALAEYSKICGITFVEVPTGGQLEYLTVSGSKYGGWAYFPDTHDTQDVIIDTSVLSSGYGFQVMLHETGHAVGLKHPFEGKLRLAHDLDNTTHTIMSYTDRPGTQHLGPLDIDAVQFLYGDAEGLRAHWSATAHAVVIDGSSSDDDIAHVVRAALRFNGNGGDDAITLSRFDDTANGGAGDDRLSGADGNDDLFGNFGNDTLDVGRDIYTFGIPRPGSHNRASGGAGDDILIGSAAQDVLRGGAGNDDVTGDGQRDTIFGGPGDDTLLGGGVGDEPPWDADRHRGDDLLYGNTGDDVLIGGNGGDRLYGGEGNDTLRLADGGVDYLSGGNGNDLLAVLDEYGGGATLMGGAGDDTLVSRETIGILDGGSGNDEIILSSYYAGSTIDTGSGIDTVQHFKVGDQINVEGRTPRELLGMLRAGVGGLVLDLGNGDELHIRGWSIADATADMFS